MNTPVYLERYTGLVPHQRGESCGKKTAGHGFEAVCGLPLAHEEDGHASISLSGLVLHTWGSVDDNKAALIVRPLYEKLDRIVDSLVSDISLAIVEVRQLRAEAEKIPGSTDLLEALNDASRGLDRAEDLILESAPHPDDWT